MTDDACREIHFEKVHFTNICAGVPSGGKGQCTVSISPIKMSIQLPGREALIILLRKQKTVLIVSNLQGDSGGPLIVDNKQVGIVSWSVKPCTYPGYPGVYTEVTYYIGWLREHTGIARLGRN